MTAFLRLERCLNFDISKDPVRPEYAMAFRINMGREVYSYVYKDEVAAVICVAYCYEVPTAMGELDELSTEAREEELVAVPYSVWSLKHGFGRSIVFALRDKIIKDRPEVKRIVTLSPKTEMAYRFHVSNGAKHIAANSVSDNYEYSLEGMR